jgi:hypothetical protein
MATINATAAQSNQPKYTTTAAIERVQTYVTSAALSNGDVIVFTALKVPHGAVVTDLRLAGDTPDGTAILQLGIAGAANLFGSATVSATPALKVLTQAIPYTVSVSDDAAQRHVTLQATVDGAPTSATASISLSLMVRYVMSP